MSIEFNNLNKEGKKKVLELVKSKELEGSIGEYLKPYLNIFICPFCNSDKAIRLDCKQVGCKGCLDIHFKCPCEHEVK